MRFGFGKKKRPVAYIIGQSAGEAACSQVDPAQNIACESVRSVNKKHISRKNIRRARGRIGMVGLLLGAVYVGLGVKLANISFSGPHIVDQRTRNVVAKKVEGPRPEILDRNGVILATNLPTIALEISGREVWDAEETANKIAQLFDDVDRDSLQSKLERGLYVEVRSDLSPVEHEKVFALGLPGVRFSRRDHRFYPQEGLAPHLIGHVEKGRARNGEGGVMGLEKVLDRSGHAEPLTSAIDVRVQQALEKVLAEGITEFSAQAGWGGVMDAKTGEIIAIASFPEFNLNDPQSSSKAAWRNRMTYDRFDLGSAFKAITTASVIDSGISDEATPYDARGVYNIRGATIKDYKGKNRILTLSEVVQFSSNIGSARMAHQMGPELQKQYLKELGMLDALPIELAENRAPDLPKKWGPVESATVSYGHGIAVTPLHLLAAFSAVVNGGEYRVPTFLKANAKRESKLVFSAATSAKLRRILRRTVINGSAKRAEVDGYYSIGKTSTADKPGVGGYIHNARISSFAGAFPGFDPRYVILVSLDNPQPTADTHGYATAGWTAAPMFKKLVERIGPILEVPISSERVAMDAFFADAYAYDKTREVIRPKEIKADERISAKQVGNIRKTIKKVSLSDARHKSSDSGVSLSLTPYGEH